MATLLLEPLAIQHGTGQDYAKLSQLYKRRALKPIVFQTAFKSTQISTDGDVVRGTYKERG